MTWMTCCFLFIRLEKLNGEADVPSGNGKRTHIDTLATLL